MRRSRREGLLYFTDHSTARPSPARAGVCMPTYRLQPQESFSYSQQACVEVGGALSQFVEAERFRARAGELRRKADQFSPENREMLFKMADNYDAIAENIMAKLRRRDLKVEISR